MSRYRDCYSEPDETWVYHRYYCDIVLYCWSSNLMVNCLGICTQWKLPYLSKKIQKCLPAHLYLDSRIFHQYLVPDPQIPHTPLDLFMIFLKFYSLVLWWNKMKHKTIEGIWEDNGGKLPLCTIPYVVIQILFVSENVRLMSFGFKSL